MCKSLITAIGLLLASGCGADDSVTTSLRDEIAPTGTLRAGINHGNSVLVNRDADTGELTGLAVDLSRKLAQRIGVPVELVPFRSAGQMAGVADADVWDVAYLAIDPARAEKIDYTAPHIELTGTYLVRSGSPLQTIADVDREGISIMVTANSAYDLFLRRHLQHAELVRAGNTPESIEMMIADPQINVLAAVRAALVGAAERIPGSRIIDGYFMTIPQAAGVPRGRPNAAIYLHDFIEEMKATGFIAEELSKYGHGPEAAIVAPAAPRN